MKTPAWSKSIVSTVVLSFVILFACSCGSSGGGGEGPEVQEAVVDQSRWYVDNDVDGFGSSSDPGISEEPEGSEVHYVTNNLDCNDDNPDINPMAKEQGDSIDHNCNGETNEPIIRGCIPDTGQTKSYTKTFGEDSDFLISPPSYTKLAENGSPLPYDADKCAMIRDEVTGLIWEAKQNADLQTNPDDLHDADNTGTWEMAAETHINKLNQSQFGGFSDWRLPTITELLYLSKNNEDSLFFIDTQYFKITSAGSSYIWSSTASTNLATTRWVYNVTNGQSQQSDKDLQHKIWAVRGESKPSTFVDRGFGVIEDTTTGLMWQQETGKTEDVGEFTWDGALQYCNDLTLSGYTDWRLPNKHELITLIDNAKKEPSVQSELFSDTELTDYWTSTRFRTYASVYEDAYIVNFTYGQVRSGWILSRFKVRAVRGGHNEMMRTWYRDIDNDLYGDPTDIVEADTTREVVRGFVLNPDDCDIYNPAIHPGAEEIPDNNDDEDCDGRRMYTWYKDVDKDGYGNPRETIVAETQPAGYVNNSSDCNDNHIAINPGMENDWKDDGFDNDCNGKHLVSWYLDKDMDGFGSGDQLEAQEDRPVGTYASNSLDCNDEESDINPSQVDEANQCMSDEEIKAQQIIPDTGQETSTSNRVGVDAKIRINWPSYEKLGKDGSILEENTVEYDAIRDKVTGLIWEAKKEGTKGQYTYEDAVKHCENLSLANRDTNWRLPTLRELAYICNAEQINPSINTTYFHNTESDKYWTSTFSNSSLPNSRLAIDFHHGTSYGSINDLTLARVRAVYDERSANQPFKLPEDRKPGETSPADDEAEEITTGLIWKISSEADPKTFTEAHAACEKTEIDAMGVEITKGWRLPSIADLKMMQTYTEEQRIRVFGESNLPHWTSSMDSVYQGKAEVINFKTGLLSLQNIDSPTSFRFVRGTNLSRFLENKNDITKDEDNTVTDLKTGLMWQQVTAGDEGGLSWHEALSYCEESNENQFAGYTDWRLPNKNELLSLMEESSPGIMINTTFFPDSKPSYWSSTEAPPSLMGSAWVICFSPDLERIVLNGVGSTHHVRLVRGGKKE